MSTYEDKRGVWIMYDYDVNAYLIRASEDIVPLARQAARQGYGRLGFLPFDMDFQDAVTWWEDRQQAKQVARQDPTPGFQWPDPST